MCVCVFFVFVFLLVCFLSFLALGSLEAAIPPGGSYVQYEDENILKQRTCFKAQCFCAHAGRRAKIIGRNKGFGRRKTGMQGLPGFPLCVYTYIYIHMHISIYLSI